MKQLWNSTKANVAYYKLAYFYGFLYSMNALGTAIVASFLNVEWENLTPTTKFIMIVVVIQNWSGTMLAFLNKTLARLQVGEAPIPTGDTTVTSVASVASVTTKPNP